MTADVAARARATRSATPSSASGTIADNDAAPTVSVAATDANGSEQGPDPIVFTVTRSANTNGHDRRQPDVGRHGDVRHRLHRHGVRRHALRERRELTLAAGSTGATLTVTPVNDTTVESTETVTLTLAAGTRLRGRLAVERDRLDHRQRRHAVGLGRGDRRRRAPSRRAIRSSSRSRARATRSRRSSST